jgi:hypothetical protein
MHARREKLRVEVVMARPEAEPDFGAFSPPLYQLS